MEASSLSTESHQQKAEAPDVPIAREVLLMTRPHFADLTADEQAREIEEFVMQRRAEWRASPELRQWVMSGAN